METPTSVAPLTEPLAWEQLRGLVVDYLRPRVGDALAQDTAQEALVRVFRHRDEIRDDEHLIRWLRRVARNAVIDELRRDRRVSSDPLPEGRELEILVRLGEVQERQPAELNLVVGRWLAQQIERLPEPQRTAVRLVDLEAVPQSELADRLGLSPSGARSRVQRGRALLARRLRSECDVVWDKRGNVLACDPKGPCCE